jgi:hypothetical protein
VDDAEIIDNADSMDEVVAVKAALEAAYAVERDTFFTLDELLARGVSPQPSLSMLGARWATAARCGRAVL